MEQLLDDLCSYSHVRPFRGQGVDERIEAKVLFRVADPSAVQQYESFDHSGSLHFRHEVNRAYVSFRQLAKIELLESCPFLLVLSPRTTQ